MLRLISVTEVDGRAGTFFMHEVANEIDFANPRTFGYYELDGTNIVRWIDRFSQNWMDWRESPTQPGDWLELSVAAIQSWLGSQFESGVRQCVVVGRR